MAQPSHWSSLQRGVFAARWLHLVGGRPTPPQPRLAASRARQKQSLLKLLEGWGWRHFTQSSEGESLVLNLTTCLSVKGRTNGAPVSSPQPPGHPEHPEALQPSVKTAPTVDGRGRLQRSGPCEELEAPRGPGRCDSLRDPGCLPSDGTTSTFPQASAHSHYVDLLFHLEHIFSWAKLGQLFFLRLLSTPMLT